MGVLFMFAMLSLLLSGLFGFFLPQWMYGMDWGDLISLTRDEVPSAGLKEALKDMITENKTAVQIGTERILITLAITLAVFIVLTIIMKIIKNAIKNKKTT